MWPVTTSRAPNSPPGAAGTPTVQRVLFVGNVCVGKSSLFETLTSHGHHAVQIPGSTLTVDRGVLTVGPAAASRAFRHRCSQCRHRGHGDTRVATAACHELSGHGDSCPAVHGRGRRRKAAVTDRGSASLRVTHLYDTPGAASLTASGEDEMVTRDMLLSGLVDTVLPVLDAKNLRRSLALALEVAEFGLPTVFCLNMIDEAENAGQEIHREELARILGVPVVPTVAVVGHGVRKLAERIADAGPLSVRIQFSDTVEAALTELDGMLDDPPVRGRAVAMLFLCGDRAAEAWLREHLDGASFDAALALRTRVRESSTTPVRKIITDAYYTEAGRIKGQVFHRRPAPTGWLSKFGRAAQRPFWGSLIALVVLVLAYYWVGAFGATYVVDNLSARLFDGVLIPLCNRLLEPVPSAFVRDAIMDPDFGLLPTGLFLALGIVLPVLFCFYLLQAVLEDSGYLARLTVLFEKLLRGIGLNGQNLIPLVLGFSCVAMAVITTRMLSTRKERIILTLLVCGVPCAPLLAVMIVILGGLPWTAAATVFGLIALRIAVGGYVASKVLGGGQPDLIMEIPPMRIPRPRVVLGKTWRRTWEFMREAVPIFLAAAFAVFVFDRLGGLALVERASAPLIQSVLGLPEEAVRIFIKTAIRREAGAAELNLLHGQFSHLQIVVTLVVMTFLIPCVNTIIVTIKERGFKTAAIILATVAFTAVLSGAALNWVCRALGIQFA